MMKSILKLVFPVLAAGFLVTACDIDDAEYAKAYELGAPESEFTVPREAGSIQVPFYANGRGSVRFLDKRCEEWASLNFSSFYKDDVLEIAYEYNEDVPRVAKILLCLDASSAARDTIVLRQEGAIMPTFSVPENKVALAGVAGDQNVSVVTNLAQEDLSFRYVYEEGSSPWISAAKLNGNNLVFTTAANTLDKSRFVKVTVEYEAAFGEMASVDLILTQAASDGSFGTEKTFPEIRAYGSANGTVIPVAESPYIEGYVVSDKRWGNVNENPRTTNATVDYTICQKSVYLESLDGKYGFLLETETEDDNVFDVNTRVRVHLGGRTIYSYENPSRYVINGIRATDVISAQNVDASAIPLKQMHMNELTDDDIYTRVTLLDCEWPIRKGSLTPVNEGYTNATGADRSTKYASLIRDINGDDMYVYTNMTCLYRRDGHKLNYGQGTMSGVIVHEKHRSYIDQDSPYEDECGNIGRYQIRHMSQEDFGFGADEDSFSEILCEWRWVNHENPDEPGWMNATQGHGYFSHSKDSYKSGYYSNAHLHGSTDFSFLGPVGNSVNYIFGNNKTPTYPHAGFGIVLPDGTNFGDDWTVSVSSYVKWADRKANPSISLPYDGKGRHYAEYDYPGSAPWDARALTWNCNYWWDNGNNRPYFWIVKFSTAGITTSHISTQFAMFNQSQSAKTHRYWKLEYAVKNANFNGQTTAAYDGYWREVAQFTVPDVVLWAITLGSQSPGPKPMNFELPQEILGHDEVYLRIGPANTKASNMSNYDESSVDTGDGKQSYSGTMSYFAVRYNK